ncbi:MAG: hypothetical protein AAF845_01920 [Bacteroidota bacterium]
MRPVVLSALALLLVGCGPGYRSTLLPTAEAGAPLPEYGVVVPDGYEVLSVDYDAALVGIATGNQFSTRTSVRGLGVLAVYAVERETGQRVVLVYDDLEARPRPTAVIRLEPETVGQAKR